MKRGFALIELLVVLGIIGILSAVVLASINTVRINGRHSDRVSDIKSLQLALEGYYSLNSGYPSTSGSWRYDCYPSNTSYTNYVPSLATSGFIRELPHDPKGRCAGSGDYNYGYKSDGETYQLTVQVPNQSGGFENCTWINGREGFTHTCTSADPAWVFSPF